MPVNVRVALITTKRINVHSFSLHFFAYRLGNLIEQPLKIQILLDSEVARHLLFVLSRCNQSITVSSKYEQINSEGCRM